MVDIYATKYRQDTSKCRLTVKLLLDVFWLGRSMCNLCTNYASNILHHILFECRYSQETRTLCWKDVECTDPVILGRKMGYMPLPWKRYIDDCSFIWTGTEDSLNIFLNYLNSCDPNITFTFEKSQQSHSVHFLDTPVILEDKLRTDLYSTLRMKV